MAQEDGIAAFALIGSVGIARPTSLWVRLCWRWLGAIRDVDDFTKSRIVEGLIDLAAIILITGGVGMFLADVWYQDWWGIVGGLVACSVGYLAACILRV